MTWRLSRFRAGDLVEVRSREEVLATLDELGRVDGLPFMPEMLKFCGQRFRVRAVAHKTCETARQTWRGRRMKTTVHLANLSCDGSAHGGCQATCTLFWKDVWLRPAGDDARPSQVTAPPQKTAARCTEARLLDNAQPHKNIAGEEPCYSCQATNLYDSTQPLEWWDFRQYVYDVLTGNRSLSQVLRVTWLAALRDVRWHVPFGYRVLTPLTDRMHRLLTGRSIPGIVGQIAHGQKTPTGRLDLAPGELVRIKSKEEIAKTLDERGQNRGLPFDPQEMAPYCGGTFRVRNSITKILDELTGKMRYMKQPCVMLEGVVCNSEFSACRLNCPRAIPSYWREIWLERVNVREPSPEDHVAAEAATAPTPVER